MCRCSFHLFIIKHYIGLDFKLSYILTQVAEVKDELKLNMVRLSEREGKLEDLEDKVETLNFIKKNYIWFEMYN